MSLFDDKLSLLLNHRLSWLGARSNLIAQNIAHADIKKAPHKDMRPFGQVLKRHGAIPTRSGQQVRILRLGDGDTVDNKKKSINRELEMLEMSRNALEHDAILSTVKNFHQLVKTILSMSQGG